MGRQEEKRKNNWKTSLLYDPGSLPCLSRAGLDWRLFAADRDYLGRSQPLPIRRYYCTRVPFVAYLTLFRG